VRNGLDEEEVRRYALYICGALQDLLDMEEIDRYDLAQPVTPKTIAAYDQLRASGFRPSKVCLVYQILYCLSGHQIPPPELPEMIMSLDEISRERC